jgi:heterodisulfide reductase subunit A
MTDRKIGVFICYCGGNISDSIDVEKVREAVENEQEVVVAKTHMFTCSDAAQQEMIKDIQDEKLNGLVVASCSPKLHLYTFRAMANRAGLNPYQYVQVNLREQCSWSHQDEMENATAKAISLVRAGIAKARLTEPLTTLRIETKPKVLIIGAGVAGLRAALALADVGLSVYVIEREPEIGGWTGRWGKMFLNNKPGKDIIGELYNQIKQNENITVFTNAELAEKSGSVGDFSVKLRVGESEAISLEVGAIIVATGFEAYTPDEGEFGYGLEGVVRLPEFKDLIDNSNGSLEYNGRPLKDIVYIHCVGSRQPKSKENPNLYCSRYCCNAAVHTALCANEKQEGLHQYHLFRDMRTYGKHEAIYEDSCSKGSIFIRHADNDPPTVERVNGKLRVHVCDQPLGGEKLEIDADMVVLITGMIPRQNQKLIDVLKLPVGTDGFFNEIHPKLRPVETMVDGVFIVGTAQGPKTMAESVASALAGASKSAALVMKGYIDLEPFIAKIDPQRCQWCELCAQACPYNAVEKVPFNGKEIARIIPSLCKGGGSCVPLCPENAIDICGYTDAQIKAIISAMV